MSYDDRAPGGRVFEEKVWHLTLLYAFLAVAFVGTIGLTYVSSTAPTTKVVLYVVFGALTAVSIATLVWTRRHPARIEITNDAVAFSVRGIKRGSVRFEHSAGDLYVHVASVGKTPLVWLKSTGSDDVIPLQYFDRRPVEKACREASWRFVDDRA